MIPTSSLAQSQQQREIEALTVELDYLIDRVEQMQYRYRKDRAAIRFNYPAFIQQLTTTRNRAAQYLRQALTEVHPAPPRTVDQNLVKVR